MKKKILAVFMTMLICIMMSQGVFAEGALTVESIFPGTDETGLQTTNQMVRIVFSGEIDVDKNKKCFKVVDAKGKAQDIIVIEQSDDPNRVNLILKKDLAESSEYTVVVDGRLKDTKGNALGETFKSKFKTRSVKKDGLVTTLMMVIMFGAVIVLTVRDTTKKQREAEEEERKAGKKKVNPYKTKDAKKEAERIRAQRKKEKEKRVQEIMEKNRAKQNGKGKK